MRKGYKGMSETLELRAIPTVYNGVQLRSRMGAQCAVLFDKLGWEWTYEQFSIMLPCGIPYIPDFWAKKPWLMVECRGYENERSKRQIDSFVSLVEQKDGWPMPDKNGNLYDFWVLGPEGSAYYRSAWGAGDGYRDIPATDRTRYQVRPVVAYKCGCGWEILGGDTPWCPNCEEVATSALVISVKAGKIFGNGKPVEDLHL